MTNLFLHFLLFGTTMAYIEDTLKEKKPGISQQPSVVRFEVNDFSDEVDDLPVRRATVYLHRRTPRAIHDPIADYLDEKAAEAVFGGKTDTGAPAAMPHAYEEERRKLMRTEYKKQPTKSADHEEDHVSQEQKEDVESYTSSPEHETSHDEHVPEDYHTNNEPHTPAIFTPNPSSNVASPAEFMSGARALPPHTQVVPYDAGVHPDFPLNAPRARGLVSIPEGWNSNKPLDLEFRTGYRWNMGSQRAPTRNWMRRGHQSRRNLLPLPRLYGHQNPNGFNSNHFSQANSGYLMRQPYYNFGSSGSSSWTNPASYQPRTLNFH